MGRLIDGDKTQDALAELADCYNRIQHQPCIANGVDLAAGEIAQQPTVTAVEVVRCRECRYYETLHTGCCKCPKVCSIEFPRREPNDFCSYGERKGGGEK